MKTWLDLIGDEVKCVDMWEDVVTLGLWMDSKVFINPKILKLCKMFAFFWWRVLLLFITFPNGNQVSKKKKVKNYLLKTIRAQKLSLIKKVFPWGRPGGAAVKCARSASSAQGSPIRILGADMAPLGKPCCGRRPT